MGGFFVFGAAMAGYAAVTLGMPGTFLDALWSSINAATRAGGVRERNGPIICGALACAGGDGDRTGSGRAFWGWVLGISIIAINAVGDIVNLVRGEGLKGVVGVVIAGLLLVYLMRPGVRDYFDTEAGEGPALTVLSHYFGSLRQELLVFLHRFPRVKGIRYCGVAVFDAGDHVGAVDPVGLG